MTILNESDSTCGLSDEELTVRFKESIRIDTDLEAAIKAKEALGGHSVPEENQILSCSTRLSLTVKKSGFLYK